MAERAACPFCATSVEVTKAGAFRTHRRDGKVCEGSGSLAFGYFRDAK